MDLVMSCDGRGTVLAVVALSALVLFSIPGPVASEGTLAITEFAGGLDNVTVTFADSANNSSAGVEVPRGATIESARMDVEGLHGFGDDVRTLDYSNWNNGTPHRAWRGSVVGNYPPTYPFWDPTDPGGTEMTRNEYLKVGTSDDDRVATTTGVQATNRYPFHMFMLTVPGGPLTGLSFHWEGNGYCDVSAQLGSAELFLWNNESGVWSKVDFYVQTGGPQDRVLSKGYRGPQDSYLDSQNRVFILVLGPPSRMDTGPNPTVKAGQLQTDLVRVNATFQGQLMEPEDVSLSIRPGGVFWEVEGVFVRRVSLGTGSGLRRAVQAAVDSEEVLPSNVTLAILVEIHNASSATVRLSNLSIVYTPVVNLAPTWSPVPVLTMYEDVDAEGLLDLDRYSDDDWSNTSLVYTVVNASTMAIRAVVEADHYLSFYVSEAHWSGRATFRVNATDPWGSNDTSPVIVVDVVEVNDPPLVVEPGMQRGWQGEPFHLQVEATDVDGDPMTFLIDTEAFSIDPATGEIDFTPTNEQVGLHRVTVTVVDGRGGETLAWMELTIANVNDPPVLGGPTALHGRQGEYLSHTFPVDDPDVIHGDLLTWSLEGDLTFLAELDFNPVSGELVWRSPKNDAVGQHVFTVRVTDSAGASDELAFTIVIENANDPPELGPVSTMVTYEDATLTRTLAVQDPDRGVDPGEELTWVVEPPLFQVAPDGTFTFVALHGHVGTHNVTVTVTDRLGASDTVRFTLVVKGLNHPPVIGTIDDQVVYEDEEWTLEIVVSDPDQGDEVQVGVTGAPFHVPPGGGTVVWTPQERHGGEYLVRLEAVDTWGGTTVQEFNLTVITRNDPPTVEIRTPVEGEVVAGGEEVFLSSVGRDEEGDHMTFTWWWRYSDSPGSMWERITTGPSHQWNDPPPGRIVVRVEVSDGEGITTDQVTIRVEPGDTDDGTSTAVLAGGLALAAVVAVLLLLLATGRLGGRGKGPEGEPEGEPEEEETWEPVTEDDLRSPVHR